MYGDSSDLQTNQQHLSNHSLIGEVLLNFNVNFLNKLYAAFLLD